MNTSETHSKPSAPRFRLDTDGQLLLGEGDDWTPVKLRPCFPWSDPDAYLSVRDEDKTERALIESLDDLEPESLEAVRTVLREARFTFDVLEVVEIDRDFDLRVWKVNTRQGARTFLTKYDDFPQDVDGGGLMIQDLAGDMYVIRDLAAMSRRTREWLFSFQ